MATKIIPLATKKIKLRKISKSMLTGTIKNPDQIVEGYGVRTLDTKFTDYLRIGLIAYK